MFLRVWALEQMTYIHNFMAVYIYLGASPVPVSRLFSCVLPFSRAPARRWLAVVGADSSSVKYHTHSDFWDLYLYMYECAYDMAYARQRRPRRRAPAALATAGSAGSSG